MMGSMREHPRATMLYSTWRELRASAKSLGADKENLGIIGWQHIFAESKVGLAKLVEKWLSDGNLMILST